MNKDRQHIEHDMHLLRSTNLPNSKSLSPPTTKIWKMIQNIEIGVVWGS